MEARTHDRLDHGRGRGESTVLGEERSARGRGELDALLDLGGRALSLEEGFAGGEGGAGQLGNGRGLADRS